MRQLSIKPIPMAASRGFTLVELMVAMGLLALIVVALGATLRTFSASEQRVDQRIERADDFRVATGFLRSTLRRISTRSSGKPPEAGKANFLFSATRNAMAWVGIMPARYGAGGKYFFRLAPEQVGNQLALVLRYTPWTDNPDFPDWNQAESRILASPLTSVNFWYAHVTPTRTDWVTDWPMPEKIPSHVRIQVVNAGMPWPELIFNVNRMPPSSGDGNAAFGVNRD